MRSREEGGEETGTWKKAGRRECKDRKEELNGDRKQDMRRQEGGIRGVNNKSKGT